MRQLERGAVEWESMRSAAVAQLTVAVNVSAPTSLSEKLPVALYAPSTASAVPGIAMVGAALFTVSPSVADQLHREH